jgi:hypothetical protein
MSDIVDTLFPRRALHIVAGASGAGKSIWLLETMTAWAKGQAVLGCVSHPEPWVYVSGDRSEEDVWRKVDGLGILRADVPLLPAYATGKNTFDWEHIFCQIVDSGAKTVVWEGFGRYVPSSAGGRVVDAWLEQVTYHAQKNDLTILGVTEQPKMKPRDKYPIPRQRISGPAAWGHHSSTVVLIEHLNERIPSNPGRILYIITHDTGSPREFKASLATGHFVIQP